MSFRIPSFYQMNMSLEEAVFVLGKDRVLEAMENLDQQWLRYTDGEMDALYCDDDDFFEHWQSEVNAYNVVYNEMKPLFVKGE